MEGEVKRKMIFQPLKLKIEEFKASKRNFNKK